MLKRLATLPSSALQAPSTDSLNVISTFVLFCIKSSNKIELSPCHSLTWYKWNVITHFTLVINLSVLKELVRTKVSLANLKDTAATHQTALGLNQDKVWLAALWWEKLLAAPWEPDACWIQFVPYQDSPSVACGIGSVTNNSNTPAENNLQVEKLQWDTKAFNILAPMLKGGNIICYIQWSK